MHEPVQAQTRMHGVQEECPNLLQERAGRPGTWLIGACNDIGQDRIRRRGGRKGMDGAHKAQIGAGPLDMYAQALLIDY